MLIAPPAGNFTGTNSAKLDMVRKNKNGSHIFEKEGMEGRRYKKRVIAAAVTNPKYILSLRVNICLPEKNKLSR